MKRWVVYLALAGAAGCAGLRVKYNAKMSLHSPYTDSNGYLDSWRLLRDASVISKGGSSGAHLVSSGKGSAGGITSTNPLRMKEWKVSFEIEVKNPGSIGFWVSDKNIAAEKELFGGENVFRGVMGFLSYGKTSVTSAEPSGGLCLGGSPGTFVVKEKRRIAMKNTFIVVLQYLNSTFSMQYGTSPESLEEIGKVDVFLHPNYYLSIIGVSSESGAAEENAIVVKNITSSYLSTIKKKKFEEEKRSRSSYVWVIFLVLIVVICYYLYQQKRLVKNKKILD